MMAEITVTVQMVDKRSGEVIMFLQDVFAGLDCATLNKIVADALYDMREQLNRRRKVTT